MKEARILFRGLFWDQIFGLGFNILGFKIRPHWSFWGKMIQFPRFLVLLGQNFIRCMTTEEGKKKLKQQTKCLFFVKGQPLYLKPSSLSEDDRMM